MKVFTKIALFLAASAGLAQSAAALTLVKAKHTGTWACSWPAESTRATYVLNADGTMTVDWGDYQAAGYVNVITSAKAVVYSIGDASGSGKIAFLPDGRVSVGTGTCHQVN
jgi:hypothetical protein